MSIMPQQMEPVQQAQEQALTRMGEAIRVAKLSSGLVQQLGVAVSDAILRWAGTMATADATQTELTEPEIAALRSVGTDPEAPEQASRAQSAFAASVADYARLISTALPTAAAAQRAGLSASRVRAMVAAGELLAIKVRGDLRLPDFQFLEPEGLVPEIPKVMRALDLAELHPVAVEQWFLMPREELSTRSVRDWLSAGERLDPVLAMAGRAAILP
jgi:hypothetical protein